jgi:hypothetical protein
MDKNKKDIKEEPVRLSKTKRFFIKLLVVEIVLAIILLIIV